MSTTNAGASTSTDSLLANKPLTRVDLPELVKAVMAAVKPPGEASTHDAGINSGAT